ncbi:MAG TPA: penicillin-binding protein activator [Alphaproteobacteria bacterium]|nr:penicillin-binding protein activator [Alphaproteobacteria bacterium]
MSSFLRISLLSCLVLALLGGCAVWPWGNGNLAQTPPPPQTEAPTPNPAPEAQVTESALPPAPNPPPEGAQATPATPGAATPGITTPGIPAPPSAQAATTTYPPALASAPAKVAIFLPLSGPYAGLGQAMLNAAQLAVFDVGGKGFQLMPHDTAKGGPAAVARAARDAIDHGAKLIIGPVFAANVAAVKPVAEDAGVNMLALTTDASLAEPGLYVMGFAPTPQVNRVTDYANAQGLHNFAALVPDNAYGNLVGDAFSRAVARDGALMIGFERFDPGSGDLVTAIAALAGDRDHIDALFLPEGGAELGKVIAQLQRAGFAAGKIKLLGTGLWDMDDLGPDASFLAGGWYAGADPAARGRFVASYQKAYGKTPPRLVTLAYDATALAALLAKGGSNFSRAALTNPNGFAGVDGIFRLREDGTVQRGLAIDQVTPEGGRLLDPAPATFAGR